LSTNDADQPDADQAEAEAAAKAVAELEALLTSALESQRADVVVLHSELFAPPLTRVCQERGLPLVILWEGGEPRDREEALPLRDVAAIVAPTEVMAAYLRDAYGLPAVHLPPLVPPRSRQVQAKGDHVVFDGTTSEHGLIVLAAIATAIESRRPRTPVAVLGADGVFLSSTASFAREGMDADLQPVAWDADELWSRARVFVTPFLDWRRAPAAALTAIRSGVPTLIADSDPLAPWLGQGVQPLPLTVRLARGNGNGNSATPGPAPHVEAWVEAVLDLFATADAQTKPSSGRAGTPTRRDEAKPQLSPATASPAGAFALDESVAEYARFFREVVETHAKSPAHRFGRPPAGEGNFAVLVPHLNGIEFECEQGLRELEAAGVRVIRRGGCSAIDAARNDLLSEALHHGMESIMFIDADIGFDPLDALRLLARPEEVVTAVYAKKGQREMASLFAQHIKQVQLGAHARGLYPLRFAAAGFLRMRAGVLRRMIDDLKLPLCNTHWGEGVWPFFQPMIVPHPEQGLHYLGEDWAFSHRLAEIGVTPLADTSIRLWHWGRYGFSWEDAGQDVSRFENYTYTLGT
jgi:hypothetical protein